MKKKIRRKQKERKTKMETNSEKETEAVKLLMGAVEAYLKHMPTFSDEMIEKIEAEKKNMIEEAKNLKESR